MTDYKAVAELIRRQIGNACLTMVGAKDICAVNKGFGGLSFKTGRTPKGKANHVEIILASDDTYYMNFNRLRGLNSTPTAMLDGICAEGLTCAIQKHTGLKVAL